MIRINRDPTRTLTLRNSFVSEVDSRFAELLKLVRDAVVEDDVFGLFSSLSPVSNASPGSRVFAFLPNDAKVASFMEWLQRMIEAKILSVDALGRGWTDTYIGSAYKRGVLRAYSETKKIGKIPSFFNDVSGEQYLTGFMASPVSVASLHNLFTRDFTRLRNITEKMSLQISEELAKGLAQGFHPNQIATSISGRIKHIGRTRARTLARTEIIRSYAEASLDTYQSLGIQGVHVAAEWLTAGDDRVCILEGTSKILTKKGLKNIKDVKVGEYVLTHKDRYKKVTKTWQRKTDENVVRVHLKGTLHGNGRKITTTDNHPFLVKRDGEEIWVPAGKLKLSDEVCYFARKCPVCDKKMPVGSKFCSPHCVTVANNKKRWADPEQHKLLSKQNKESGKQKQMVEGFAKCWENAEFRETFKQAVSTGQKKSYKENPAHYKAVSDANKEKGKRPDWGWKNKERGELARAAAAKVFGKNRKGGSWIEKKVEWWLGKLNLKYEAQKYLFWEGKRRWVDFYLPEYNLFIEVDGEHWHKDKEKDAEKDRIAKERGYTTLRLPGKMVRYSFDSVIEEINKAIHNGCFVFVPIRKLDKWKLKKNQPVYNLTVEEDNSYIANYMVVHNCDLCEPLEGVVMTIEQARDLIPRHPMCRCTWLPYTEEMTKKDMDKARKGLLLSFGSLDRPINSP